MSASARGRRTLIKSGKKPMPVKVGKDFRRRTIIRPAKA